MSMAYGERRQLAREARSALSLYQDLLGERLAELRSRAGGLP